MDILFSNSTSFTIREVFFGQYIIFHCEFNIHYCKEIQPVHPKGGQSWVFIGRTDVEAETPIIWPPDAKNWLIWKDPDAGKDWGQEEKGTTDPHPGPPSQLPPLPSLWVMPVHQPQESCILHPASNLDWRFVSYMILYMLQCHSPKSSYPLPLPQSPKDCSIHLCLFCCLVYRVIVTIFLNSIYMH